MNFGQILTGTDIKTRLQTFIGNDSSLSDLQIAYWINAGLGEIRKEGFLALTQEYSDVNAYQEYELPYDFRGLVAIDILDNNSEYYIEYNNSEDVKITKTNKIIFPEDLDKTIRLTYYPILGVYDDLNLALPILPVLRPAILNYVISEYYSREGEGAPEENQMVIWYRQLFDRAVEKELNEILRKDMMAVSYTKDELPKRAARSNGITSDFLTYDGNEDVEDL